MLLQTNSYIVPKDKRAQHARLVHRFRQTLTRLGCDHFEAYEQVGANWSPADTTGRFVQLMRFRDRKQQLAVQAAERNDATAQALIKEFCELINFPYQQQQGLFAVGFYHSLLPTTLTRTENGETADVDPSASDESPADSAASIDEVSDSPEPGEPAQVAGGVQHNGEQITGHAGEQTIEHTADEFGGQPSEPHAGHAVSAPGESMDVDEFLADDSLAELEPMDEIEVNEERR